MAWHYGTYSCGHEGRINVIGPSASREYKIGKEFSGLCPECYKKARAEELDRKNEEAAKKSEKMELPDLVGTEKQAAWANSLRINFIEKIEGILEGYKQSEGEIFYAQDESSNSFQTTLKEVCGMVEYVLKTHTDARFWIDNRNNGRLIFDMVSEYRDHANDIDIPDEIKEEIKMEEANRTVLPECGKRKIGIVIIEFDSDNSIINAKYIKDFTFIEVVKELGYKWNGNEWRKSVTEFTGNADDLAAKLGNKLLLSGFTVQFPSSASKSMSISGNFKPENDRWIKFHIKQKKLAVCWKKKSDALYDAARKLPGARWHNGTMLVGIEFYKEVEDFVETMGFSISKMAQEEIEKYKQTEFEFDRAEVFTPDMDEISDRERIAKSLKRNGTIIEDLMDD